MDLSEIEGLLATFCAKETTFDQRLITQAQLKQWLDNFNKNMGSEPLSFEGLLEFWGDHNKARSLRDRKGWAGTIWELQSPEGYKIKTANLSEFAREQGLNEKSLRAWLRNGRAYDSFLGWRKISTSSKDLIKYKSRKGYFESLAEGSPEWEREKLRLEEIRNRRRESMTEARLIKMKQMKQIRDENRRANGETIIRKPIMNPGVGSGNYPRNPKPLPTSGSN